MFMHESVEIIFLPLYINVEGETRTLYKVKLNYICPCSQNRGNLIAHVLVHYVYMFSCL